ncbi:MAG: hypothetical protein H6619_05920, partial [Deltaproteobacteria bacterium]|nr:hypothetical protein [Deltaproteobacteria bacterium]
MDKKNLVFTVLAVALVVVVVFMPDLLTPSGDRAGLRSSISSRLDASKGEPKAGLRRDSSSPSSPLSRVLDTFESKTRVSHKNDQPLVNKPATWGMIQKGEYHEVLASARNRAHIIAKELGGESI